MYMYQFYKIYYGYDNLIKSLVISKNTEMLESQCTWEHLLVTFKHLPRLTCSVCTGGVVL